MRPRLALWRVVLSQRPQAFYETLLARMAILDNTQSAAEILGRPVLVGDCLKVEKKAGGFVVAGAVAACDLGLDLEPDILA